MWGVKEVETGGEVREITAACSKNALAEARVHYEL